MAKEKITAVLNEIRTETDRQQYAIEKAKRDRRDGLPSRSTHILKATSPRNSYLSQFTIFSMSVVTVIKSLKNQGRDGDPRMAHINAKTAKNSLKQSEISVRSVNQHRDKQIAVMTVGYH